MREDAGMDWTTVLPTASGYYWWRESGSEEPCIVEVDIKQRMVSSLGTEEAVALRASARRWDVPSDVSSVQAASVE